jgi:hypothetical protein
MMRVFLLPDINKAARVQAALRSLLFDGNQLFFADSITAWFLFC